MKHLRTLVLTAFFIGATSFITAQSKVAHINLGDVITAMQEYKTAKGEVDELTKTYEAQIQDMIKELDKTLKQYDAEAPTKTQDENAKRVQEVEGVKQSIAQFQQQAQVDIQKKEAEKIKPIREKAQSAVKKVAAALGYEYVLDLSTLVVATGKDITADVKKELGIQ